MSVCVCVGRVGGKDSDFGYFWQNRLILEFVGQFGGFGAILLLLRFLRAAGCTGAARCDFLMPRACAKGRPARFAATDRITQCSGILCPSKTHSAIFHVVRPAVAWLHIAQSFGSWPHRVKSCSLELGGWWDASWDAKGDAMILFQESYLPWRLWNLSQVGEKPSFHLEPKVVPNPNWEGQNRPNSISDGCKCALNAPMQFKQNAGRNSHYSC